MTVDNRLEFIIVARHCLAYCISKMAEFVFRNGPLALCVTVHYRRDRIGGVRRRRAVDNLGCKKNFCYRLMFETHGKNDLYTNFLLFHMMHEVCMLLREVFSHYIGT